MAAGTSLWTADQIMRWEQAERGLAVVANLTFVWETGQRLDGALIAWAQQTDRFVYIGQRTPGEHWSSSCWNNPFSVPEHGDWDMVEVRFRNYLRYNIGLQKRLPRLRGKVPGCWCRPQTCHVHVIAEAVNAIAGG